jgi:hypothetical protein
MYMSLRKNFGCGSCTCAREKTKTRSIVKRTPVHSKARLQIESQEQGQAYPCWRGRMLAAGASAVAPRVRDALDVAGVEVGGATLADARQRPERSHPRLLQRSFEIWQRCVGSIGTRYGPIFGASRNACDKQTLRLRVLSRGAAVFVRCSGSQDVCVSRTRSG